MHSHTVHPVRIEFEFLHALGARPTHKQAIKMAAVPEHANHLGRAVYREEINILIGVIETFPRFIAE